MDDINSATTVSSASDANRLVAVVMGASMRKRGLAMACRGPWFSSARSPARCTLHDPVALRPPRPSFDAVERRSMQSRDAWCSRDPHTRATQEKPGQLATEMGSTVLDKLNPRIQTIGTPENEGIVPKIHRVRMSNTHSTWSLLLPGWTSRPL